MAPGVLEARCENRRRNRTIIHLRIHGIFHGRRFLRGGASRRSRVVGRDARVFDRIPKRPCGGGWLRRLADGGYGGLRTVSRGSRWVVGRSGWRTVSYGDWRWLIAAVGKRSAAAAGRRSAATAANAPVDKAEREVA